MCLILSGIEIGCELIKTRHTKATNFSIIIQVVTFKCYTLFSDLTIISALNEKADNQLN